MRKSTLKSSQVLQSRRPATETPQPRLDKIAEEALRKVPAQTGLETRSAFSARSLIGNPFGAATFRSTFSALLSSQGFGTSVAGRQDCNSSVEGLCISIVGRTSMGAKRFAGQKSGSFEQGQCRWGRNRIPQVFGKLQFSAPAQALSREKGKKNGKKKRIPATPSTPTPSATSQEKHDYWGVVWVLQSVENLSCIFS